MAEAPSLPRPSALLFDLDGTLIDTAPDMIGTLHDLRAELSLPPMALDHLRACVSRGALPLLDGGLPEWPIDARRALRERYLAVYAQRIARASGLFPGMAEVLALAAHHAVPWAIVTNKPYDLAHALLDQLGLTPGALLGGDSLPEKKPHPLPLQVAMTTMGRFDQLADAWMIGDDARDIEAGRRAGCRTVACAYGYFDPTEGPAQWAADLTVQSAGELAALLTHVLTRVGPLTPTRASR